MATLQPSRTKINERFPRPCQNRKFFHHPAGPQIFLMKMIFVIQLFLFARLLVSLIDSGQVIEEIIAE